MDATHFDVLVRRMASPDTRRGLLTIVAGGFLGVASLAEGEARKSGKCQPACDVCQTCRKGRCRRSKSGKKRCQRGKCNPLSDGTACLGTGTCQSGECICPTGTTRCDDACVNTAIDPRNCGTCGARCQLNAVCTAGSCGCASGVCTTAGASCCPPGSFFACICSPSGSTAFTDPATCNGVPACPAGTTTCVGPQCQACCPAGSTCDTSTGTCLQ